MEQIKHISGGPGGPKYMGDSGDGKSRWLDLLISEHVFHSIKYSGQYVLQY